MYAVDLLKCSACACETENRSTTGALSDRIEERLSFGYMLDATAISQISQ